MDADDISLPRWLQTQMDFLKQNPKIDVVSCHICYFDIFNILLRDSFLITKLNLIFYLTAHLELVEV